MFSQFFQGLYNELSKDKDGIDLTISKPVFPKEPTAVPGKFTLTFSAKVSPCFNTFILKLNIV
jgi:hypothetical protein